jgi:hypothetical protein
VGLSSTDLPRPQSLVDLDYEIVNVDVGILSKDIQAYRKEGLGVNVYTVDQRWLFSQFWLMGVTSVTTNNIQNLSQLNQPFLNIPYSRFLLFWGLYGIIVAIWLASSQPDLVVSQEKPDESEKAYLADSAIERNQESWLTEANEVDPDLDVTADKENEIKNDNA